MEQPSSRLWTKDFIFLAAINFFITLIFFSLVVTIGHFAVERFDASASMAGLIASIFIVGALVGRISISNLFSLYGNRAILLAGLILFLLATASYFIVHHVVVLLIVRFIHGVALGVTSTVLGTIVAQSLPAHRKGEGIGYYSLSSIISTAIGPFVGMLMTQYADFQLILMMNMICASVCFILFLNLHIPDIRPPKKERGFSVFHYVERKAVPISFVGLFIGFAYSGILSFLTFYVAERHLVTAGSYFYILFAVVILCTRPFTGRLYDMRGANLVVYPCLLLFTIGMFVFSIATTSFLLLLAAALIGIGYGNFNSVAQAIAIKSTTPERIALATSTYFIFFDIGLGFGPYVLGYFIGPAGYAPIFSAMVVVIVLATAAYYWLYGRKERALLALQREVNDA